MVERRNGASLLRETRSMLASEPFYGNDSIQPEIAGLPYIAHASLADELKNSIGSSPAASGMCGFSLTKRMTVQATRTKASSLRRRHEFVS